MFAGHEDHVRVRVEREIVSHAYYYTIRKTYIIHYTHEHSCNYNSHGWILYYVRVCAMLSWKPRPTAESTKLERLRITPPRVRITRTLDDTSCSYPRIHLLLAGMANLAKLKKKTYEFPIEAAFWYEIIKICSHVKISRLSVSYNY